MARCDHRQPASVPAHRLIARARRSPHARHLPDVADSQGFRYRDQYLQCMAFTGA